MEGQDTEASRDNGPVEHVTLAVHVLMVHPVQEKAVQQVPHEEEKSPCEMYDGHVR